LKELAPLSQVLALHLFKANLSSYLSSGEYNDKKSRFMLEFLIVAEIYSTYHKIAQTSIPKTKLNLFYPINTITGQLTEKMLKFEKLLSPSGLNSKF
jgi:hypothetical protein